MARSVRVAVPASSANLGPGFDCMAAAVDFWLQLEVNETGRFELEHDLDFPKDRDNLLIKSFERIRSADGLHFKIISHVPGSGGLGSSAAAIVAGLAAASALEGGSSDPVDLLPLAADIEGHADNVAAALHGGIVIVENGRAVRITPPKDLTAVFVVPNEAVATAKARAALPESVPMAAATGNIASAASLVLGLERGDFELIARSLDDALHQPHRASLYPRSSQLMSNSKELGALGATISGAGPTVMLWAHADDLEVVAAAATAAARNWAEVFVGGFAESGVSVS